MNIDEIRQFFQSDKYLVLTDVHIEDARLEWCRCSLKVQPFHMNSAGAVQGGALYTLADSAFAVAANLRHMTEHDNRITVSQSASISYISAGKSGSTLYAEAHKVGGGKRSSVYRVDITDREGLLIATMTCNGCVLEKRRTNE